MHHFGRSSSLALSGVCLATLAACSSPVAPAAGGASAPAGGGAASSQAAPAGGGGACSGWTAGQGGVIRLFCDGPAKAKVTVAGTTTDLAGGQCDSLQNMFVFNIGVVTGSDFPADKAKPDYLGVILPESGGDASTFVVILGGKADLVMGAKGTVAADKKSAKVSGTSLSKTDVSVEITCG